MKCTSESPQRGLFRQPDVSQDHIVFVFGGDVWIVEKEGGVARRLTSARGEETFPRFSPCGEYVGFSGNYGGNTDLYVIPTASGVPRRLTYHPLSDRMVDWYPDGERLLFASARESHYGVYRQLFEVSARGGPVKRLPLAFGEYGAISPEPDGRYGPYLAFQIIGRDFESWKRYRGGAAPDLYLYDFRTRKVHRLTESPVNEAFPMWHGGNLYFVSDLEDEAGNRFFNLFVIEDWREVVKGKLRRATPRRLTAGDEDLRFPAVGPSDLVFVRRDQIFRVDLTSPSPDFENPERVEIELVADRAPLVPVSRKVGDRIQSFDLSPNGEKVAVAARGKLFVFPADGGLVSPIGGAVSSAERSPAWAGGERIVFHSDARGEYDLMVHDLDDGKSGTVAQFPDGFRYAIHVSPKGDKAAFVDQANRLWIADLEGSAGARPVARAEGLAHPELQSLRLAWSPDERFLAFVARTSNRHRVLRLFDVDMKQERKKLASGFFDDDQPAFDPDGKYLYFLTRRGLRSVTSELDGFTWAYVDTVRVARVPLLPPDLSSTASDAEAEAEEGSEEEARRDWLDKLLGSTEAFESHVEVLPLAAGSYGRLYALPGDRLLMLTGRDVVCLDATSDTTKTLIDNVDDFVVSADGGTLLARRGSQLLRLSTPRPGQPLAKGTPQAVDTSGLVTVLDRGAEWRQIFEESGRLVRDFFHDGGQLDRVDWPAQRKRYRPFLRHVVTRQDLNYLLAELYGEIESSHTGVSGGDLEAADAVEVGLLGADLELHQNRFRVGKILRAGPWEAEVRSPLLAQGIAEGSYLMRVDGVELDPQREPWAAFEGRAGRAVALTIRAPSFRKDTERTVVVLTLTLEEEKSLRLLEWIERNRLFVKKRSRDRVGYVYIPNTAAIPDFLRAGRHLFVRQFRAQFHLEGLVFDGRFNSGGFFPQGILERIGRKPGGERSTRFTDLGLVPLPTRSCFQVMLINAWSVSAGDVLPFLFQRTGLGDLVGTRTWGAVNFSAGLPQLVDGGRASVANVAHVDPLRRQRIENVGVFPNVEVPEDLGLATGRDVQFEAAVRQVLDGLG